MSNTHCSQLEVLAEDLKALDLDVTQLRALLQEISVIEEPPGLAGRVSSRTQELAERLWREIVGELAESRSAVAVINRSVAGDEDIPEKDILALRAQLVELLKVTPAGLLAFAVEGVPIAGGSVLTPRVLAQLNLMPPQWRVIHVLETLRQEAEKLRQDNHPEVAVRVDEFRQVLAYESIARENIESAASLQTFWDANGNGKWDPEEREAHDHCLADLRSRRERSGTSRRWYVSYLGAITGPVRLTDLNDRDPLGELLVCFDGKTGWVELRALFAP